MAASHTDACEEKDPYEGYRGADGTIYDPNIYKKKKRRRGSHKKRCPINPETGRRMYNYDKRKKHKGGVKKDRRKTKNVIYLTEEEEIAYQVRAGLRPKEDMPVKVKKPKVKSETPVAKSITTPLENKPKGKGGTIVKVSKNEAEQRHIKYNQEGMTPLEKRKWWREHYEYEIKLLESGYSQKDVFTLSRVMGAKLSEETIRQLKNEFVDN